MNAIMFYSIELRVLAMKCALEREERERKVPKQKATLGDLEKVKREVFGEE